VSSSFSVALFLVVILAGCCVVLLGRRRHLVFASIDFDILSAPFGNYPSPGAPYNGISEMAARYRCTIAAPVVKTTLTFYGAGRQNSDFLYVRNGDDYDCPCWKSFFSFM
jgi:hypothetical protein